jgi:hypothetical protein
MIGKNGHIPYKCAWMCADMQRFGNFSAGVPELEVAVRFPGGGNRNR